MHDSLLERARCHYGDEFRPDHVRPGCCRDDRRFVERLTFAGAEEILELLDALSPNGVEGRLPVWVHALAHRLLVLQRPDDPVLLRRAATHLFLHDPEWDHLSRELEQRAERLERARRSEPAERSGHPPQA